MALPPNLATPTLVTGKTNQSQVVDVYANNPDMKDNVAQNTIPSVLAGAANGLFSSLTKSVSSLLSVGNLTKDMNGLLNTLVKTGGDLNAVKSQLKGYRDGALTSILESTGIGDPTKFKNGFVKGIVDTAKSTAFGTVKGFVDNLVPGVLESANIKSFDDLKNTYKGSVEAVRDLKNLNTDEVLVAIGENPAVLAKVSNTVISGASSVINTILAPVNQITSVSDPKLDTAVLVAGTQDAVSCDDNGLNGYMLDAFGSDTEALNRYLTTMLPKACAAGAYKFINLAATKVSSQSVSWMIGNNSSIFLSNVNISPLPVGKTERDAVQEAILSCLEIVFWKKRAQFNVGTFTGITDSVYNVLKFGPFASMATIASTAKVTTATDIIQSNFNDFCIA